MEAVAAVRRDVEHVRVVTARDLGAEQATIFDAHLSLLTDAEMLADVKARTSAGVGAVAAWADCLADVEHEWASLPDPYLRERAADVHAVADQVVRALTGEPALRMMSKGVLVASDLTPAEAAGLDLGLVTGVVLAEGSATSHAAILARARDIPVVVAAGPDVLAIPEGSTIVLDGGTGELHVDPSAELLEEYRRRAADASEQRARQLELAETPAVSRDGIAVAVAANLGSVADARAALAAGADGAGLVRTEFLFLGRSAAPSVQEQQDEYAAIAEAMDGRPDHAAHTRRRGRQAALLPSDAPRGQPIPRSAGHPAQPRPPRPAAGPAGGDLSHGPDASDEHDDPHGVDPGEMIEARQVLMEAAGPGGLPDGLHVGTMIEVPSAALKIEAFLPHVDFVSIGTNDLTQYTLAAERGNGAVAELSDPLDPGVLQLIDHVCRAARGRIDVAVCGEAASDELAIPVLVGLGVRELSVAPPAVPRVKAAVRELDVERCASLAREALSLAGAGEVRKLVLAMLSEPTR